MDWTWAKVVGSTVAISALASALEITTKAGPDGQSVVPFPWNLLVATGAAIGTGFIAHKASNNNPDGTKAELPYKSGK